MADEKFFLQGDEKIKQVPTPDEWARAMPDAELLERMVGYAIDAELTQAVALEVKRRFESFAATFVKLRPRDGQHSMLCDGGERGGPDVWLDGSQDPEVPGMRAVKFVEGQGLVDDPDPQPPHVPYVGWCCHLATLRQEIDACLKVKP